MKVDLTWRAFTSLVALSVGLWLLALCAADIVPGFLGYPGFERDGAGWVGDGSLLILLVLAFAMVGLSLPLARGRNWARLVLVSALMLTCGTTFVALLLRLLHGRLSTPDEIGEFLIGMGILILPAVATSFLLNKQVVDEFTSHVRGRTQRSDIPP
jgi:hypothetical protein